MGDGALGYRPAGDQKDVWETGTQLSFDPLVSSAVLTEICFECPRCELSKNIRKPSLALCVSVDEVGLC